MSLYQLKVALMIVMCVPLSKSLLGRLARGPILTRNGESSRARPGGTRTHVAHRANTMTERRAERRELTSPSRKNENTCRSQGHTMTERRAHEPGDGGFLYVFGVLYDTYPTVISCKFIVHVFRCVPFRYIEIHLYLSLWLSHLTIVPKCHFPLQYQIVV